MNIVHNCLDKWIGTPTEHHAAIRWEGEEGAVRVLTYGDLWRDVNRCANAWRELGIGPGDRVALFMSMTPELIVAFFARFLFHSLVVYAPNRRNAEAAVAEPKPDTAAQRVIRAIDVEVMKPGEL